MKANSGLVGTRLAAAGAALYFLEWVAIAFLPEVGDASHFGDEAATVVEAYRGHGGTIAFAAGWLAFVLLGRILFMVALRKSFRDSGRDSALIDFAVAAMTVSVVVEIASFGPTAAAGWIADTRTDASAIVALEAAGSVLFYITFVPLGVAVVAASAGMLASRLFPRWLGALGLLAASIVVVGGIVQVAALGDTGTLHDLGEPLTNFGALGFWIWLIAASVILWRHTPPRAVATA